MTNLREAAQMALDYLESEVPFYECEGNEPPAGITESIEALRAALAQLEHEEVEQAMLEVWQDVGNLRFPHITQQEPVAWWDDRGDFVDLNVSGRGKPLYFAPPQREWQGLTEGETIDLALSAFELPEVSSETREKIHRDLVIAMNDQDSRLMLFAANIEAKLKEKNNG